MRNHVHLIVEARDKDALAAGMKVLKGRIIKALNRLWSRGGRRHERQEGRGVPGHWVDPCSSGRQFGGWRQNVRREHGVVEAAKTWLLSAGWRRAGGGLDVHAIPG